MLPVLALLIVGAWAQGQGGHDPIPDKCCTSHQFTALMAEVGEVFHAGVAVPVDVSRTPEEALTDLFIPLGGWVCGWKCLWVFLIS